MDSKNNASHLTASILVLFVIVLACLIVGYKFYDNEKKLIKARVQAELTVFTEFKAQEIDDWLAERNDDARAISKNTIFANYVYSFLKDSFSSEIKNNVYTFLKSFQASPQYKNIAIIDRGGNIRLSLDKADKYLDESDARMANEAFRKTAITFIDFHREEKDGTVSLHIYIPIIFARGDRKQVIALVLIRIDPTISLYPMIQKWPIRVSTGESLLVRREGGGVVCLNELRYKRNASLSLKAPLVEEKLLPAMAIPGKTGVVEGKDYRGVDVLAVIKAVPGTSWFLVEKLDVTEVYSPVQKRFWIFVIFASVMIAMAGTIMHNIWVNQQARVYLTNNQILQNEIKERKQAEETLEERTRQLEAVNRELENFSYSVSHDLRAPLRAIDGFSRMLAGGLNDKLDEVEKHRFNVIISNAMKMNQLIDDVLAFSRMGRASLTMTAIDMENLTTDVWSEFLENNPQMNVAIKIAHPMACYSHGDYWMMKRVLTNLLSNAIKFTKYRKNPAIELGSYEKENECVYYVKDNGVGFDMRFADKLFNIFQRLHSDSDYEGTGAGLSIVKRIIERHGGSVWAEGKVNEGATFYFSLPKNR